MPLAVAFGLVIAATFGLLLFMMQRGGGRHAVRRQLPTLLVIGAAVIGYAALLLLIYGARDGLLLIGAMTAAMAAGVAGVQGLAATRRHAGTLTILVSWLSAAVLATVAVAAAVLFFT